MVKFNLQVRNDGKVSSSAGQLGTEASSDRKEDLFTRQKLKEFVGLPMDGELSFTCPKGDGRKIIKRLRVKMSRIRKKATKQKVRLRYFKMIVMEFKTSEHEDFIRLRKAKTNITVVSDILNEFPLERY